MCGYWLGEECEVVWSEVDTGERDAKGMLAWREGVDVEEVIRQINSGNDEMVRKGRRGVRVCLEVGDDEEVWETEDEDKDEDEDEDEGVLVTGMGGLRVLVTGMAGLRLRRMRSRGRQRRRVLSGR